MVPGRGDYGPGGVVPGVWWGGTTPCEQTDPCKIITFPQLRLRVVTNSSAWFNVSERSVSITVSAYEMTWLNIHYNVSLRDNYIHGRNNCLFYQNDFSKVL